MTSKPPTTQKPKRALEVKGKLAEALDYIAFEGMAYDEAARKANLTVRAMRMALGKRHVIRYLRAQRDVLLASMSGANVLAMAAVRSQTENQNARVAAVKQLEAMSGDLVAPGVGLVTQPGLVIWIHPAPPPPIDPASSSLVIHHDPGPVLPRQGGNGDGHDDE